MLQEGIYTIKARANGKYVCRDNTNASYIANRDVASAWERFTLHKRGNYWAIQDWKGGWWLQDYPRGIEHFSRASPGHFSAWFQEYQEGDNTGTTKWTIEHVGGDDYAFRGKDYLRAEPSGLMFADRQVRDAWETFTLTRVGGPEILFVGDGTVYRIDGNGDLLCYRHDDNGGFYTSAGLGDAWGGLRWVSAVQGGHLYGVDQNGNLLYYRHEGEEWPVAGKQIGDGWGGFRWVGVTRFGHVYAITTGGELLYYRHDDAFAWQVTAKQIGEGWGGLRAFAGGTNALYAINGNNELIYYYHDDALKWRHQGVVIGWGWGDFVALSSAGNGEIYAVNSSGELLFYRHDVDKHFIGGSGKKIGEGWGGRADQAVIAAAR